jgi:hypothetical protein
MYALHDVRADRAITAWSLVWMLLGGVTVGPCYPGCAAREAPPPWLSASEVDQLVSDSIRKADKMTVTLYPSSDRTKREVGPLVIRDRAVLQRLASTFHIVKELRDPLWRKEFATRAEVRIGSATGFYLMNGMDYLVYNRGLTIDRHFGTNTYSARIDSAFVDVLCEHFGVTMLTELELTPTDKQTK